MKKWIAFIVAVAIVVACKKSSEEEEAIVSEPLVFDGVLSIPSVPYNYSNIALPAYFHNNAGPGKPTDIDPEDNMPGENQITNWGATLGRVLFYDKNLSKNNTVSCASCHKQSLAFGDSISLSKGFSNGDTRRHSMGLVFARYYRRGKFFWDERAATLEQQVLMPIQDEVEMGLTLSELQERVASKSYYTFLFKQAFGDENVSTDRISKALAQFVRSIVSYNSKYDQGRAQVQTPGQPFPNFTASENEGKNLFVRPINQGGGACFGCHTTEAFINDFPGPINNGLDAESTTDKGAFETEPNPRFLGAFKVPSLRGVGQRSPYMHDGRFKTLEEVVEHYNSGIKNHPNLGPALRDSTSGQPVRLNFTNTQKANLVSFLRTLDDQTLTTEPKYSDPFIK